MAYDCSAIEDSLYEVEEVLTEAQSELLREHISNCEACRAERELFLDSWDALQEIEPDFQPTPTVRAKVWQKIQADQESAREKEPPRAKLPGQLIVKRLAVAGLALFLGFGFGRGLAPEAPPRNPAPEARLSSSEGSGDFLDPTLIKLASQEGYSVEIFPESTDFSPIDQEMMSALAPTEEDRSWVQQRSGAVVPVTYISQEGGGAP